MSKTYETWANCRLGNEVGQNRFYPSEINTSGFDLSRPIEARYGWILGCFWVIYVCALSRYQTQLDFVTWVTAQLTLGTSGLPDSQVCRFVNEPRSGISELF
jgi:hypothetical protein